MATGVLTRSLNSARKLQAVGTALSRSFSSLSSCRNFPSSSSLIRLRPLVTVAPGIRNLYPDAYGAQRGFSTRQTSSSLSDTNPNWSNRPPKETILLDGCDFEHWLVVVEPPKGDLTRDGIIDSYIKVLAKVVGSEEEARMKIYSVSTRHYYAFGALVSEEVSYKIKELEGVRWVLPDSYLDVKNKDYGGEPFINGQAVPYDPKYHEEWVRNNARANERNRRNDRPRNFDRSRNFERRQNANLNAQHSPGPAQNYPASGGQAQSPNQTNNAPPMPNQNGPAPWSPAQRTPPPTHPAPPAQNNYSPPGPPTRNQNNFSHGQTAPPSYSPSGHSPNYRPGPGPNYPPGPGPNYPPGPGQNYPPASGQQYPPPSGPMPGHGQSYPPPPPPPGPGQSYSPSHGPAHNYPPSGPSQSYGPSPNQNQTSGPSQSYMPSPNQNQTFTPGPNQNMDGRSTY